jgi:hypothetical protein
MMSRRDGAVLALHWQVNVIKPEGFFGGMLSQPVTRSGVIARAVRFHAAARQARAELGLGITEADTGGLSRVHERSI